MLLLLNFKHTADFGADKAIEIFSTKRMWFYFNRLGGGGACSKSHSKPHLGTSPTIELHRLGSLAYMYQSTKFQPELETPHIWRCTLQTVKLILCNKHHKTFMYEVMGCN
jgi:hypothetical protein